MRQDHLASAKLVTASPSMGDEAITFATGNEWVSVPCIDPRTGAVRTVEVLSARAQGLLGFSGGPGPLLAPFLEVDGGEGTRADGGTGTAFERASRPHDWWVELEGVAGPVNLKFELFAPVGHRGFVLRLTAKRPAHAPLPPSPGAPIAVRFGLSVNWAALQYTLFRTRPMPATLRAEYDTWTHSVVMEAAAGIPVIAWAIAASEPVELVRPSPAGEPAASFRLERAASLAEGDSSTATFFVSVAPEADGARTTNVDMRRRGFGFLAEESRAWLAARRRSTTSPAADSRVNLNLLYTYFFGAGRTLEDGQWVAVTSRSPRYYVSAAYWARDTLLWSLPGLLELGREEARRVLVAAFRSGWKSPGIHAQYLGGCVLYPGFELDELAAYPVALGQYLERTADESVLAEESVRQMLTEFAGALAREAGDGPLYATFLDPSDDPPPYPFLTYDNALLLCALHALGELYGRLGDRARLDWAHRTAGRLCDALRTSCVVEGPFGPMFAWAVDGNGAFTLYDDPPGSLQLLGVLGACPPEEPALLNTIRWVHSEHNPHHYPGPFGGVGCAHAPHPWPMSSANTLRAIRVMKRPLPAWLQSLERSALQMLAQAPMDGDIACETVDPATGRVRTGAAFATAAGYLASALLGATSVIP